MSGAASFRSLLLVEHSTADLILIRTALEELGLELQVAVARDGVEAVTYLRTHPCPDVTLMDINMPHMTGFEVLDMLRDCPPEKRVVLWSTAWSAHYAAMADEAGADAYLKKPSGYGDLMVFLRTLFGLPQTQP